MSGRASAAVSGPTPLARTGPGGGDGALIRWSQWQDDPGFDPEAGP
jgi:hypothetical protein